MDDQVIGTGTGGSIINNNSVRKANETEHLDTYSPIDHTYSPAVNYGTNNDDTHIFGGANINLRSQPEPIRNAVVGDDRPSSILPEFVWYTEDNHFI